jgi:hypothetical protein
MQLRKMQYATYGQNIYPATTNSRRANSSSSSEALAKTAHSSGCDSSACIMSAEISSLGMYATKSLFHGSVGVRSSHGQNANANPQTDTTVFGPAFIRRPE